MEFIQKYVPKDHIKLFLTLGGFVSLNILLLNSCIFFGCYEMNITNIFRLNLFCNACTDMSYHLQKYQLQIYMTMGGYFLKKINENVNQYTNSKFLSKN